MLTDRSAKGATTSVNTLLGLVLGVCEVVGCRAPTHVTGFFSSAAELLPFRQPSSGARQGRASRPRLPALVADRWPEWDGNPGRAGSAGHRHDSAPAWPRSLRENAGQRSPT